MSTKTHSKHQKELYASYKAGNRMAINRKRKLERALKLAPNNEQIALALKTIGYRRKTPKTSQWSHTSKAFAHTKKQFAKQSQVVIASMPEKAMYRLKARAHDSEGNLVWNS